MKKYVFTIKDDVCAANGKDTEATELIEKMKLWGTVEDYDKAVASVCAEYQGTIDNLKKQLGASVVATEEDEILFLNFYRERKAKNGEVYQARINELETQAANNRADYLKKAEQISLLLNQ